MTINTSRKAISCLGYTVGALSLGLGHYSIGQELSLTSDFNNHIQISQEKGGAGRHVTYSFEKESFQKDSHQKNSFQKRDNAVKAQQVARPDDHKADPAEINAESIMAVDQRLHRQIEMLKKENAALKAKVTELLESQRTSSEHINKFKPEPEPLLKNKFNTVAASNVNTVEKEELKHHVENNKTGSMIAHASLLQSDLKKTKNDFTKTSGEIHHVVYIFKNKAGQQAMWEGLKDKGVTDRWQGHNTKSDRYFIYVGAYLQKNQASLRAEELSSKTGITPLVYGEKK